MGEFDEESSRKDRVVDQEEDSPIKDQEVFDQDKGIKDTVVVEEVAGMVADKGGDRSSDPKGDDDIGMERGDERRCDEGVEENVNAGTRVENSRSFSIDNLVAKLRDEARSFLEEKVKSSEERIRMLERSLADAKNRAQAAEKE